MFSLAKKLSCSLVLCGVGFAVAVWCLPSADADDDRAAALKSQVVRWADAKQHKADWGEMRFYFTGETAGTKDVLTAVAVVKPGMTVHAAHRHAEEEYLVVADGSGTWSLDGKDLPAKQGDVLFVEPWVYHGVTNTGTEPMVFLVFRYNSKGIPVPPRPDDRPDEL